MPDPMMHTVRRGRRERMEGEEGEISISLPPPYPGVLPLVRHGDHVSVKEMFPVLGIAAPPAGLWRLRLLRISLHPRLHDVVVELLGPQEPCTCMIAVSVTPTLEWSTPNKGPLVTCICLS